LNVELERTSLKHIETNIIEEQNNLTINRNLNKDLENSKIQINKIKKTENINFEKGIILF